MKKLTESLEKYLLAIHELSKTCDSIMVKDVSSYLNIGGPSTAEAIRTLAERGFINYVPYGTISLTQIGMDAIEVKVYRHEIISKFLNRVLDIDEVESCRNAKAIEYSMTEEVLTKFVHFLDFMEQCTCKDPKWIKSCKKNLEDGTISEKCSTCISNGTGCSSCCGGCGNS